MICKMPMLRPMSNTLITPTCLLPDVTLALSSAWHTLPTTLNPVGRMEPNTLALSWTVPGTHS